MAIREVEEHSRRDAELSEVRRCIREGVWSIKECVKYFPEKGRTVCYQQSGFKWNSHYSSPKSEIASTSYCTGRTCWNCCYETETEDQSMMSRYRQRR